MNENVIEIKQLYKKFKVYDDFFVDRIKEKIFFWNAKKYYRDYTAIDNINLTVKKGEVLGLIGPNGAGKTTLLKILAQICYPTSGEVKVKGSLVAVLALGLGFNPRYTGRENIVIGGSLLGMSLKEIKDKEKWIIEFSELKDFIDQPVRSYSSGMQARLSFSVAAAVSPEILIIDEALATGDAFFVQKSLGRIHDITKRGTTAIFVSHNLQQIQRLCSERVVLLEKGKVVNDGKAVDVLNEYNNLLFKYREEEALKRRSPLIKRRLEDKEFAGNGDIIIERVYFLDERNNETSSFKTGDSVDMHLDFYAKKDKKDVKIIVHIENYAGICAYGFHSTNYFDNNENKLVSKLFSFKSGKGKIIISFNPILLTTNNYLVSVTLYDSDNLVNKDADYLDMTIFVKKHLTEFSVFKSSDLNTSLIFEHPVNVKFVQV